MQRTQSYQTTMMLMMMMPATMVRANNASCVWHRRGPAIYGSRHATSAGTALDISENGAVLAIEEYGNADGPYKVDGHGTGRLRVMEWDDASGLYKDVDMFTEGLSTDLYMNADGSIISTIGFNAANDGVDSEIDWLVQVYARAEVSSSWITMGPVFGKGKGLEFYPTTHHLSRDGSTIAISGGSPSTEDKDIAEWQSIHQVYRYDGETWGMLGNEIVLDGGIVKIALSETGNSLAILTWEAENDLSHPRVTARVFDLDQPTVGNGDTVAQSVWKQRGTDTMLPVADMRIPIIDIHLNSDASIFLLQALEETASGAQTKNSRTSSIDNTDDPGFIFVYECSNTDNDGSMDWKVRAKLSASESFGFITTMSSDASTLVVGGIDNDDRWKSATGFLKMFAWNSSTDAYAEESIAPTFAGSGLALTENAQFVASGLSFVNDFTGGIQVYERRPPRECDEGGQDDDFGSAS